MEKCIIDKEFLKDKVDKEFLKDYWKKLCLNVDTDFIYRISDSSANITSSHFFKIDDFLIERYIVEPYEYWYPNEMFVNSFEITNTKKETTIEFEINQHGTDYEAYRNNRSDDYSFYIKFQLSEEEYNDLYAYFEKCYKIYKKWYDDSFMPNLECKIKKLKANYNKKVKKNFEDFKEKVLNKNSNNITTKLLKNPVLEEKWNYNGAENFERDEWNKTLMSMINTLSKRLTDDDYEIMIITSPELNAVLTSSFWRPIPIHIESDINNLPPYKLIIFEGKKSNQYEHGNSIVISVENLPYFK